MDYFYGAFFGFIAGYGACFFYLEGRLRSTREGLDDVEELLEKMRSKYRGHRSEDELLRQAIRDGELLLKSKRQKSDG